MAAFSFLSALSPQAANSKPPTKIFQAIIISVPGSYLLENDITGGISVQASNVDINLNKHIVYGGISIPTYEPDFTTPVLKVHVYNGSINGSILFIGGSYCLINNLTLTADYTQGQNTGIIIEGEYPKYGSTATVGGSYNRVENCSIAISSMAVGQSPSAPDRFPDIVPSYAFFLSSASHNIITDNTIQGMFYGAFRETDYEDDYYATSGENAFTGNHYLPYPNAAPSPWPNPQ
jgi:hypothetical protein